MIKIDSFMNWNRQKNFGQDLEVVNGCVEIEARLKNCCSAHQQKESGFT
jgi:hypothetical protein